MSAQAIESICGAVVEEGESPSWFRVGVAWRQQVGWEAASPVDAGGGRLEPFAGDAPKRAVYEDRVVTRIDFGVENRGDHGVGWFTVMAGDFMIARLNERHVHEVYYEIPRPPDGG